MFFYYCSLLVGLAVIISGLLMMLIVRHKAAKTNHEDALAAQKAKLTQETIHDLRSILGEIVTATELSSYQDPKGLFQSHATLLYSAILHLLELLEERYGKVALGDMEEVKHQMYHLRNASSHQELQSPIAEDNVNPRANFEAALSGMKSVKLSKAQRDYMRIVADSSKKLLDRLEKDALQNKN